MTSHRHLHLLSEGEKDEIFYERLCERLSGFSFEIDQEYRARAGSNYKTVLTAARLLLNKVKHYASKQEIAVVIALDNDRAPDHPGGSPPPRPLGKKDREKESRHAKVQKFLDDSLDSDPSTWPVDVAVAIPVEMIESWLLPLLKPKLRDLPIFAEASQPIARKYYGGTPPPQLKDLRDEEAKRLDMSLDDLFYHAADTGDLDRLAESSRSFALFSEQVKRWRSE